MSDDCFGNQLAACRISGCYVESTKTNDFREREVREAGFGCLYNGIRSSIGWCQRDWIMLLECVSYYASQLGPGVVRCRYGCHCHQDCDSEGRKVPGRKHCIQAHFCVWHGIVYCVSLRVQGLIFFNLFENLNKMEKKNFFNQYRIEMDIENFQ